MLRVKSFKITDDKGFNALLDDYRLAPGSSILVSEGHIMVSYDDARPPTPRQQANVIQEEINELVANVAVIVHSQEVNDQQIAEAKTELDVATATYEKETANHPRKKLKEKMDNLENRLTNLKGVYSNNEKELARLDMNIERLREKVDKLLAI